MSAVLPVYNRASSLERAIESVLAQTVDDLELIVVDDASSEPVGHDIASDHRVRVLTRTTNGGVAAAQNTGLNEARGEFVAFIHSDDRWAATKLQLQIDRLAGVGEEIVGIESSTERIQSSGRRTVPPRLEGRSYADLLHRRVKNLHISGFLFRRSPLLAIGGFDEGLRAYEDLDLLIRLRRDHDFVYSDDVVAVLDQSGADRLGTSPWMQRGREHLLAKYESELLQAGGELPPEWRAWSLQAALCALETGHGRSARVHLRQSVGRRRTRWVRRWPLLVASYAGTGAGRRTSAMYRSVLGRRIAGPR